MIDTMIIDFFSKLLRRPNVAPPPDAGPPPPLDPRGLERALAMRNADPNGFVALHLARGTAAVPKEEMERRMLEFYERERQARAASSTDGQPPEEGKTGRD